MNQETQELIDHALVCYREQCNKSAESVETDESGYVTGACKDDIVNWSVEAFESGIGCVLEILKIQGYKLSVEGDTK